MGNIPAPLTLNDQITRNELVLSTEIDDEVVLMHNQNGRYYGLNAIGGEIWKMLKDEVLIKELITHLQDQYDGDSKRIETDVLILLNSMYQNKLISCCNQ